MANLSNHYDAMTAIQGIIQGIGLTGISTNQIKLQEILDFKSPDIVCPCVLIAPYGVESYDDEETVQQESPIYPTAIAIVADADNNALDLELRLQWRQQIRRRMKNVSLTVGNPSPCYKLNCKPYAIVDTRAWTGISKFVSGFIVDSYFQEPRT